jgi:dihydrofolate reductase
MRTLAITQNITLDGSIEMLGDWFDPQGKGSAVAGADMSDVQEATRQQSEGSDAMVLGRQTFEDFRGYWPHQTDDTTGVADELNRIQKYVVSSTLTDPGWQNSTVLGGDPVAEVQALKELDGLDLVVTGSIRLSHALLLGGVVDELRLWTYPVLQGAGRRLFPDGFAVDRLRLRDCRAFSSGVTLTTYALG